MRNRLAVTAAVLVMGIAVACSNDAPAEQAPPPHSALTTIVSTSDSRSPVQITGVTRAAPATPAPLDEPPSLTASAGDGSVPLRLGTNCWLWQGGPDKLCADALGIMTARDTLRVASGEAVTITGVAALGEFDVTWTVHLRPETPVSEGASWYAWRPTDGIGGASLQIGLRDGVLRFDADLAPERYIVSIFIVAPQGDATFGLLLDVE